MKHQYVDLNVSYETLSNIPHECVLNNVSHETMQNGQA